MEVRPISLRAANAYVAEHHRHHPPTRGHKFSVALHHDDELVGVAIVGRPVARHLDDGVTAEVLRVCTNGQPNGCSMLYRACWRACKAMGYRKIVTYTLADEPGTSLRAAGFRAAATVPAASWSRQGRPRTDHLLADKVRWEGVLSSA